MKLLKLYDLESGTIFRFPGDPTEYKLFSNFTYRKQDLTASKADKIIGENDQYFEVAPKIGGEFQRKIKVFAATDLPTTYEI